MRAISPVLVAALLGVFVVSLVVFTALPLFSAEPGMAPRAVPVELALRVYCEREEIDLGDVVAEIVSGLRTELSISIENNNMYPIYIDYIDPIGNITRTAVNPPVRVPPMSTRVAVLGVDWGPVGARAGSVFPGDVLLFRQGVLERVEDGAVYVGAPVPTTPPLNYQCPFGYTIYTPMIEGDVVEANIEEPGCAPVYAGMSDSTRLFTLSWVEPIEWFTDLDLSFYLHVYGEGGENGYYVRAGSNVSTINMFYQYFIEADKVVDETPLVLAGLFDASTGSMVLLTGDNETLFTDTFTATPPLKTLFGVGRLARIIRGAQAVLALDTSISMWDEIQSAKQALLNSVDFLSQYNAEIAVVFFSTGSVADNPTYQQYLFFRLRGQAYYVFLKNYQLVASIISSAWLGGGDEYSGDVIYYSFTRYPWNPSPLWKKVVVIITDEPIQYYRTGPQAVRNAVESNPDITLVVLCGGGSCGSFSAVLGGLPNVIIQPYTSSNLVDILEYIFQVMLRPPEATISSRMYVGVFRDWVVKVNGLVPGDVVIVAGAGKAFSFTANESSVVVNLLEHWTPEEIAEVVFFEGGFTVFVVPSHVRVLELLPKAALVHVYSPYERGKLDTWVRVGVRVIPNCTQRVTLGPGAQIVIEKRGDVIVAVIGDIEIVGRVAAIRLYTGATLLVDGVQVAKDYGVYFASAEIAAGKRGWQRVTVTGPAEVKVTI